MVNLWISHGFLRRASAEFLASPQFQLTLTRRLAGAQAARPAPAAPAAPARAVPGDRGRGWLDTATVDRLYMAIYGYVGCLIGCLIGEKSMNDF